MFSVLSFILAFASRCLTTSLLVWILVEQCRLEVVWFVVKVWSQHHTQCFTALCTVLIVHCTRVHSALSAQQIVSTWVHSALSALGPNRHLALSALGLLSTWSTIIALCVVLSFTTNCNLCQCMPCEVAQLVVITHLSFVTVVPQKERRERERERELSY